MTPRVSVSLSQAPKKNGRNSSVPAVDDAAAVENVLAGAELAGVVVVRAALARRLAVAVDAAPAYSLARLAEALEGLLEGMHYAVNVQGTARTAERILREVR